jgi:glycerate 2-kinase
MKALVAFDKFKDALAAREACAAAAAALPSRFEIDVCPLTDGGEGFGDILTRACAGNFVEREVTGPLGAPTKSHLGIVPASRIPVAAREMLGLNDSAGEVAVIEMAEASGLALLPRSERDPWRTSTLGTGELMRAAFERRVEVILLGVGGSATNDLGVGALSAIGIQAVDANGAEIAPAVPARWGEIADFRGRLPEGFPRVLIACDVNNPLLGPQGCTAIYAPQKGLKSVDHARMEAVTDRVSALLCRSQGKPLALRERPGAGAAGGIAFGLMCAAGAELVPGFDLVSAWFDLEARIAAADVVLTGEGRFDDSSLHGKGPGAIVRRALELNKPAHVFAGSIGVATPHGRLALHGISPAGIDLASALAATRVNLAAAVSKTFPR